MRALFDGQLQRMKPWELLGQTRTPEGEEMTLVRHGTEYIILAAVSL